MQRALLLAIGSFFVGVYLRSVADIDVYTIMALLMGACAVFLLHLMRPFHTAIPVLVVLCALSLGIVRTEFAYRSFEEGRALTEASVFAGEGTIFAEPDVRDEHTNITVATHLNTHAHTVFIVRVPHMPEFSYGDTVYIEGTVRTPKAFETDTGRMFAYDGYLMKDGVHYELARATVSLRERGAGNPVIDALLQVKTAWLDAVSRIIPEPSASLLGGVVVGAKRSLGEAWLDVFRDTGIIHIVVLSGYNLTIVALFIVWLTRPLSRNLRLGFGIAGIVAFALMTGAGATVIRASVMAVLALLAQFLARPYAILRALVLAAFLMVLVNPFLLLFDPGFQLSFVATLGLILLSPLIEKHLTLIPQALGLRTIVSATLATQLAVLPLLLYLIGEVSVVAPLVNVLVLPVVPFVMAVGFAAGVLGMVSATLAAPFAFLTNGILAYIFIVAEWFDAIPYASVQVPPVPGWIVPLLYSIAGVWLYRNYRIQKPLAEERAVSWVLL